MIKSFRNPAARAAWDRRYTKGVPADVMRVAHRKLLQVHHARSLRDLQAPPGNRLEALRGDRAGQHGIRINDQWRICFEWTADGPAAVEIVDYH